VLKRPSSRRKSSSEQIQLNLVPILDTMVALIAFLLLTTSFLSFVSIESPFPQASSSEQQKKLKERPLQLTVSLREKETEIWSPFDKFPAKTLPNPQPGIPDIKGIHETLIGIKQKFMDETKVIIVPYSTANYDTLIAVMDAMRGLEKTDPPLFRKNPQTKVDEAVKSLFPDVIFGNLLGGT
jgi:biopolymer transport protein ExbD